MMYVITFIAGMLVGACALVCWACTYRTTDPYEETMNNFTNHEDDE